MAVSNTFSRFQVFDGCRYQKPVGFVNSAETELIRRIFSSTKRRKKRKKGSVILVGMGRVSCRNSYQVRSGMNYDGTFIHAGTISGNVLDLVDLPNPEAYIDLDLI